MTANDQKPMYNIKAVARLVGLLPVTLRAWERRYGMPVPGRGDQGYRLYSEYDIRTLRWLKAQIESGLSIGRAIDYLNDLRKNGYDPAAEVLYHEIRPSPTEVIVNNSSQSIHRIYEGFLEALLHFNEAKAQEIIRRAFTLYAVDQVLTEVIEETLVTLGEAWHRGELPIAVEHYATQFCMQHLMSMLAAAAAPTRPGCIVAACAPGEEHQMGLLMLVVMLRWRGWDVKYLGPNLSLDRLEEPLRQIHPQIVLFSANRLETARELEKLPEILSHLAHPQPKLVLGGQAFAYGHLAESVPAIYLKGTPAQVIENIESLMPTD